MTETLTPTFFEGFNEDPDEEANQKRALKAARQINYAVQTVTVFVNEYAPRSTSTSEAVTRRFTHLPVDRTEVVDMADRFNVVAEYVAEHPAYHAKTGITPVLFERLHQEIEASARCINPLRSIHILA